MMFKSDVVIVGAGLTGLSIAYFLRKSGISINIIEARSRIGGRIYTKMDNGLAPVEMGATWLGKKHESLTSLLSELGIGIYEQTMGERAVYEPISTSPPQIVPLPPNPDPSYRISGGTSNLIETLASQLNHVEIHTGSPVLKINFKESRFTLSSNEKEFQAPILVSTLPPNLLVNSIDWHPQLPEDLMQIAKKTHTWMGESIKIALRYKRPFWKEKEVGCSVFSNVGPVSELYDHSDEQNQYHALKGFLNGAYYANTREERLAIIIKQLSKYYPDDIDDFISYEESVWVHEPYTYANYDSSITPHQNNGHPIFRQPYFNEKFIIAGSETSVSFPGYMEGAILSARQVADIIMTQCKK